MNLQQLKVFVLAVELQKLYLVAQKLEVTQPTVTFHLNKLQEDIGVSLFHTKSYHVIKLTEAGKPSIIMLRRSMPCPWRPNR